MAYRALEYVSVTAPRPYDHSARTHSKKQIRQIANSIQRFGFTTPVLISERPIGTPDRHPIGTLSSYVSGD
jgi:ParB-like chromosome segregation protein Spo0J